MASRKTLDNLQPTNVNVFVPEYTKTAANASFVPRFQIKAADISGDTSSLEIGLDRIQDSDNTVMIEEIGVTKLTDTTKVSIGGSDQVIFQANDTTINTQNIDMVGNTQVKHATTDSNITMDSSGVTVETTASRAIQLTNTSSTVELKTDGNTEINTATLDIDTTNFNVNASTDVSLDATNDLTLYANNQNMSIAMDNAGSMTITGPKDSGSASSTIVMDATSATNQITASADKILLNANGGTSDITLDSNGIVIDADEQVSVLAGSSGPNLVLDDSASTATLTSSGTTSATLGSTSLALASTTLNLDASSSVALDANSNQVLTLNDSASEKKISIESKDATSKRNIEFILSDGAATPVEQASIKLNQATTSGDANITMTADNLTESMNNSTVNATTNATIKTDEFLVQDKDGSSTFLNVDGTNDTVDITASGGITMQTTTARSVGIGSTGVTMAHDSNITATGGVSSLELDRTVAANQTTDKAVLQKDANNFIKIETLADSAIPSNDHKKIDIKTEGTLTANMNEGDIVFEGASNAVNFYDNTVYNNGAPTTDPVFKIDSQGITTRAQTEINFYYQKVGAQRTLNSVLAGIETSVTSIENNLGGSTFSPELLNTQSYLDIYSDAKKEALTLSRAGTFEEGLSRLAQQVYEIYKKVKFLENNDNTDAVDSVREIIEQFKTVSSDGLSQNLLVNIGSKISTIDSNVSSLLDSINKLTGTSDQYTAVISALFGLREYYFYAKQASIQSSLDISPTTISNLDGSSDTTTSFYGAFTFGNFPSMIAYSMQSGIHGGSSVPVEADFDTSLASTTISNLASAAALDTDDSYRIPVLYRAFVATVPADKAGMATAFADNQISWVPGYIASDGQIYSQMFGGSAITTVSGLTLSASHVIQFIIQRRFVDRGASGSFASSDNKFKIGTDPTKYRNGVFEDENFQSQVLPFYLSSSDEEEYHIWVEPKVASWMDSNFQDSAAYNAQIPALTKIFSGFQYLGDAFAASSGFDYSVTADALGYTADLPAGTFIELVLIHIDSTDGAVDKYVRSNTTVAVDGTPVYTINLAKDSYRYVYIPSTSDVTARFIQSLTFPVAGSYGVRVQPNNNYVLLDSATKQLTLESGTDLKIADLSLENDDFPPDYTHIGKLEFLNKVDHGPSIVLNTVYHAGYSAAAFGQEYNVRFWDSSLGAALPSNTSDYSVKTARKGVFDMLEFSNITAASDYPADDAKDYFLEVGTYKDNSALSESVASISGSTITVADALRPYNLSSVLSGTTTGINIPFIVMDGTNMYQLEIETASGFDASTGETVAKLFQHSDITNTSTFSTTSSQSATLAALNGKTDLKIMIGNFFGLALSAENAANTYSLYTVLTDAQIDNRTMVIKNIDKTHGSTIGYAVDSYTKQTEEYTLSSGLTMYKYKIVFSDGTFSALGVNVQFNDPFWYIDLV